MGVTRDYLTLITSAYCGSQMIKIPKHYELPMHKNLQQGAGFRCLLSLLCVPSQKKAALYPSSSQSSVRSKILGHVVQLKISCRMGPTSSQTQLFQLETQTKALPHHHQKHSRTLCPLGNQWLGSKAQYWQLSMAVLSKDQLY